MQIKDKYTVGNVCLVVFLAFIFSLLIATVKVQPAYAAPAMTMPQTGTGAYDSSTGAVRLNIQLSPVSATSFGSLRYYVKILQESTGAPLITTSFTQFTASSATSVSGTVYDNLVSLVYTTPTSLSLASTFTVVYSTLTQTSTPDSVYLTLLYRPPATGGSGGGGGGGGGGTTFSGSTGTINVDVAAGVATVQTDSIALNTNVASQLNNQTPTVTQTTTTDTTAATPTVATTKEVTYTVSLVPEKTLVQPDMTVALTSDSLKVLSDTLNKLQQNVAATPPSTPGTPTTPATPATNTVAKLEVQVPFAGGTLTLDVAALVAQAQAIAAASPSTVPGQLPEIRIVINTADIANSNPTSAGYTSVSSTVQFSIEAVTSSGVKKIDINGQLSSRPTDGALLAALASDAPVVTAATTPRKIQLVKLTMQYDPNGILDTNRLAAQLREENGATMFLPRVVVNADARSADLYLDRSGYVNIVQWVKDFSDIGTHWAKSEIIQMASRGVINGYPDGKFDPNGSVTRAQFAAMVLRTLGVNQVKPDTAKFKDVPGWTWYYQAVETAAKLGLVTGYGDGTFKPNAKITRSEMAVIIMRAESLIKDAVAITSAEKTALFKDFADASDVPSWALDASARALKANIVQGRTQTTFQPLSDATRAESVVMLKRLLKYDGHIQ